MRFIAIDVETANSDMSTICQIGTAEYHDDELVDEWVSYVNPEVDFNPFHSKVHGITKETVALAPTFASVYPALRQRLDERIIVSHTLFDRTALRRAVAKSCLTLPIGSWLDSAMLVKRACPNLAQFGLSIKVLCGQIKYDFRHHHALEDAKAAAALVHYALRESGESFDVWARRLGVPIALPERVYHGEPGDRRLGTLAGEVLVFTGALTLPRADATALAQDLGGVVGDSVTKKTTLLVIGDQDVTKFADHEKSSKHRKAEELIESGRPIRIISEGDFLDLVAQ
jgi:DNA polymerase-3 subunit epsilon